MFQSRRKRSLTQQSRLRGLEHQRCTCTCVTQKLARARATRRGRVLGRGVSRDRIGNDLAMAGLVVAIVSLMILPLPTFSPSRRHTKASATRWRPGTACPDCWRP